MPVQVLASTQNRGIDLGTLKGGEGDHRSASHAGLIAEGHNHDVTRILATQLGEGDDGRFATAQVVVGGGRVTDCIASTLIGTLTHVEACGFHLERVDGA